MAIIKTFSQIREGDYIRAHAHNANPNYAFVWRKVIVKDADKIVTVDRNGRERVFPWETLVKPRGMRFKAWQPGDPREDGDNL